MGNHDDTPADLTPTRPPMSKAMRAVIDIGSAFLLAYAVALIALLIMKGWALSTVGKSLFLFALGLFFPFVAAPYYPIGLVYIALFAGLFYLTYRYVPGIYRIFSMAVVLLGWEVYGIYCLNLVAP